MSDYSDIVYQYIKLMEKDSPAYREIRDKVFEALMLDCRDRELQLLIKECPDCQP